MKEKKLKETVWERQELEYLEGLEEERLEELAVTKPIDKRLNLVRGLFKK